MGLDIRFNISDLALDYANGKARLVFDNVCALPGNSADRIGNRSARLIEANLHRRCGICGSANRHSRLGIPLTVVDSALGVRKLDIELFNRPDE